MLELCPNCNKPVIYAAPTCLNHRSSLNPALFPHRERVVTKKDSRQKKERVEPAISLETLIELVAQVYNEPVAKIRNPDSRVSRIVEARRQFIYIGIIDIGHRRKIVADFVQQSLPSMSQGMQTIRECLHNCSSVSNNYHKLRKSITELRLKDPDTS